jgi:hypothetical protein
MPAITSLPQPRMRPSAGDIGNLRRPAEMSGDRLLLVHEGVELRDKGVTAQPNKPPSAGLGNQQTQKCLSVQESVAPGFSEASNRQSEWRGSLQRAEAARLRESDSSILSFFI